MWRALWRGILFCFQEQPDETPETRMVLYLNWGCLLVAGAFLLLSLFGVEVW